MNVYESESEESSCEIVDVAEKSCSEKFLAGLSRSLRRVDHAVIAKYPMEADTDVVCIRYKDFTCLDPGGQLSDSIIDFYIKSSAEGFLIAQISFVDEAE